MPPRIANQRAIIDRRALADAIAVAFDAQGEKSRPAVVELLRAALDSGRAEIARRLEAKPSAGSECAQGQAFLVDQLVRVIYDHIVGRVAAWVEWAVCLIYLKWIQNKLKNCKSKRKLRDLAAHQVVYPALVAVCPAFRKVRNNEFQAGHSGT